MLERKNFEYSTGETNEDINSKFLRELEEYKSTSIEPCTKKEAIKLLCTLNKDFLDYWYNPVKKYLPAVSEGTMKLSETLYNHEEAISHAKRLIENLNPSELARVFLYGVAHNAPEYRTALAAYYYIKNLPEHDFEKKCSDICLNNEVHYIDNICEICDYKHKPFGEPKMQFLDINLYMYNFYVTGAVPFRFDLNTAIIFMEEYLKQPTPQTSREDLDYFNKIIDVIENAPPKTTPAKLRTLIKQSISTKIATDNMRYFIDMLGYLNILHTKDSFGVTVMHTERRNMKESGKWDYFSYPVTLWTSECGVDREWLEKLFGGLYQ